LASRQDRKEGFKSFNVLGAEQVNICRVGYKWQAIQRGFFKTIYPSKGDNKGTGASSFVGINF